MLLVPITRQETLLLRPPAQFFQPLSHLLTARLTSIAMFTVRLMDSQDGQQGAHPNFQVHYLPLWDSGYLSLECCVSTGGGIFEEAWQIDWTRMSASSQ